MFSRREKVLLAGAIVAVVTAVGFQMAGIPGGRASLDQGSNVDQWRSLKKRVGALEGRLAAITSQESEVVPRLLRAAQASSAATGVSLVSLRPRRAAKTASGCLEQSIEIQARGRFPDLARFMFDIEERNARIRLASVSISSIEATSDAINSTIVVVGYSPGEVQR